MKVNVVDGDVVDLRFGGSKKFESANGGFFDGCGERCVLDQGADDGEGAAVGMRLRGVVGVFLRWLLGFGERVVVGVSVAGFMLVLLLGLLRVDFVRGMAIFEHMHLGC